MRHSLKTTKNASQYLRKAKREDNNIQISIFIHSKQSLFKNRIKRGFIQFIKDQFKADGMIT